jgi:hypothetical protein
MNNTTHYPNHDLEQDRQRLETLVKPTHGFAGLGLRQLLTTVGEKTMKFLTSGNDLRIWQRTSNGRPIWFAHDPITNRTRSFTSEQDVRQWLDNRYYE